MKATFLALLCAVSINASTSVATYDVEHTLLGKIARADVIKELDGENYTAELIITTTGLAATFSDNLQKSFISQGVYKNGVFYPDVLAVIETRDRQERYIIYRFDHKNRVLHVDKCSSSDITQSTFNPISFSFDTYDYNEFTYDSHRSKSYVKDDVISLFFNAKNYIQKEEDFKEVSFMAAGIYDEEDDDIDGVLAFGISKKDIRDIIHTSISNSMLAVALSNKVFHEDDKWLYIDLNEDTLPQHVTLNDIAFGDVTVTRILDNVASSK
jgi:hypothetical protein